MNTENYWKETSSCSIWINSRWWVWNGRTTWLKWCSRLNSQVPILFLFLWSLHTIIYNVLNCSLLTSLGLFHKTTIKFLLNSSNWHIPSNTWDSKLFHWSLVHYLAQHTCAHCGMLIEDCIIMLQPTLLSYIALSGCTFFLFGMLSRDLQCKQGFSA